MGIDETEENNRKCIDEYFGHGVKKSNPNNHPKVSLESFDPDRDSLLSSAAYCISLLLKHLSGRGRQSSKARE